MSVITTREEPNLWEEICREYRLMKPPFKDEDETESVKTDVQEYNPAAHTPVLFGSMFGKVDVDTDVTEDFDPALSHPAMVGYSVVDKPPKSPPPPSPPPPDKDKCSPRDYLEHYIFPILLPGILEMLKKAKEEKCFERKRFKFNGCDFLTEYLWKNNPGKVEREEDMLEDIPFVQRINKEHPRPPLPLSLVWTETKAALVIQSFYRGYLVRRDSEVQELRIWQKELREESEDITEKIEKFWKEREHSEADSDKKDPKANLLTQAGMIRAPERPVYHF